MQSVLCHRDFHAANLMIDANGRIRIIDHQDARIGSPRTTCFAAPGPCNRACRRRVASRKAKIALIDEDVGLGLEASVKMNLRTSLAQTVQRCLKAVGTFSYQSVNRGKTYFLPYIKADVRDSFAGAHRPWTDFMNWPPSSETDRFGGIVSWHLDIRSLQYQHYSFV